MIKQITTVLLLSLAFVASAQKKITELSIGDRCPDLISTNVLNYPGGKLKLSDFKGKLLILDLMRTNCSSCIAAFPGFQQLQKQFAGKIQFIIVLQQSRREWLELTKKNKLARELTLPVLFQDSTMSSLFPYFYSPHEVWLGVDREVKAITAGEYITASNIQQALNEKQLAWAVKKDIGDYTFENAFLDLNEKEYYNTPFYYSAISGHRQGTNPARKITVDSLNNFKKLTIINAPLTVLFRHTMPDKLRNNFANNRYLLQVKDPSRFIFDSSKRKKYEWDIQNTWCYEATVPLGTSDEAFRKKLENDLDDFLNLTGRIEKRKMPCYVLQKLPSSVKKIIIGYGIEKPAYKTTAGLVEVLNLIYPLPFVDRTGITGDINLPDLKEDIYNLDKVKEFLVQHGFSLELTEQELDVYVITEK